MNKGCSQGLSFLGIKQDAKHRFWVGGTLINSRAGGSGWRAGRGGTAAADSRLRLPARNEALQGG